jgi:hypothetical protein
MSTKPATANDPAVTAADVASAEQEAAEAQELVKQLEEAVLNGDDNVSHEQLRDQKSLAEYARLRAESTRRKVAALKAAERLAQCEALRSEIEAYAVDGGEHLAELLKASTDKMLEFHAAVKERNDRITDWRTRAGALGIPAHTTSRAEHGGLSLVPQGPLFAGKRRVEFLSAGQYAGEAAGIVLQAGLRITPNTGADGTVFDKLAAIDAETASA